jgi:hypothetical protein
MSANNSQVVSGQDASIEKAGNQTKPTKLVKRKPNKNKPDKSKKVKKDKHDNKPVERISKEEIKMFRSGCACSFDMEANARFAERIRKQEEEDKRNGYVSPGEKSDDDSDSESNGKI